MKITIEVDELADVERLMDWLREGKFIGSEPVNIKVTDHTSIITRGDKSIDPTELFGIWEDSPRTLEVIRKDAWGDRL